MTPVTKPQDKGTTAHYEESQVLRIMASGKNPDGSPYSMKTREQQLAPLGFRQATDLSAAITLSSIPGGIPAGSLMAVIQPEDADVRWRDDGTAPNAGVGMYLFEGSQFEYTGDLTVIQFIELSASGKLNISYYGEAL